MLEKSPTRGTPVSWREIQLPEVAGAHRGSARADTQVVLCRWLEHSRDSPRVPLGPTDDTEGAAGCGATSRRRLHVPASVVDCVPAGEIPVSHKPRRSCRALRASVYRARGQMSTEGHSTP